MQLMYQYTFLGREYVWFTLNILTLKESAAFVSYYIRSYLQCLTLCDFFVSLNRFDSMWRYTQSCMGDFVGRRFDMSDYLWWATDFA